MVGKIIGLNNRHFVVPADGGAHGQKQRGLRSRRYDEAIVGRNRRAGKNGEFFGQIRPCTAVTAIFGIGHFAAATDTGDKFLQRSRSRSK